MCLAAQQEYRLSQRRAYGLLSVSRARCYYRPRVRDDAQAIALIQAHIKDNPGHGFGLLHDQVLQRNGIGKTRGWRVYCQLKMNLPRRGKQRLPERVRDPLTIPTQCNETWSADFMSDALWSGRRFRTFNVNDDHNRECLRIEIGTSLPSARVIEVLDQLKQTRGLPKRLRLDNGPEFISHGLKQWAKNNQVELVHIQPGKPTQNALIERFNRTFRTEVLDRYVFESLEQVQRMSDDWRHRYNHQRTHRALGKMTPIQYAMAQSQKPLL